MPLRFLADMGVSPLVVSWLRSQGHEATHLSDQGLQRMTDLAIFQKAATEHRILLTFDLDFGEIAALSGIEPVTVILFRLANTRTENVRSRLEAVLREVRDSLAEAAVITVEDTRHRVRRLPIGTG